MSEPQIFHGRWTDHSYSGAYADTLTLSAKNGRFLLTGLTTWTTTFALGGAMAITYYLLYQLHLGFRRHDRMESEHRVALRNAASPWSLLLDLFSTLKQCRHENKDAKRRSLLVALPVSAVLIGFIVAGVFVAKVASTPSESVHVLEKSGNCGFLKYSVDNLNGLAERNKKLVDYTLNARTYAAKFYGNNSGPPQGNILYPVQKLPYNVTTNTTCPFESTCMSGDVSAFSMDTGPLDSHDMFGINAPSRDRILFRKRTICSPLHISNYSKLEKNGQISQNATWQIYLGSTDTTEYTYDWSNLTTALAIGYTIKSTVHFANTPDDSNPWRPIMPLNLTDADVTLVFVAQNAIVYSAPVRDPFFSANGTYTMRISAGPAGTWYKGDHDLNALACADKAQICNPITMSCTTFGGLASLERNVEIIGLNAQQLASARRLTRAALDSITHLSIEGLGTTALLAQESAYGLMSQPLPDDQWHLECRLWFETSLAKLQAYIGDFITNSGSQSEHATVIAAKDWQDPTSDPKVAEALDSQCHNQRVRTVAFVQRFSFAGVMIIFCVGGFLALLGLCMAFLGKKFFKQFPSEERDRRRRCYKDDDKLMLLRRQERDEDGSDNGIPMERPSTSGGQANGSVLAPAKPHSCQDTDQTGSVNVPRSHPAEPDPHAGQET